MSPHLLRRSATAAALALALVAAGCGDDDDGQADAQQEAQPEAQPAPDVTTFEEGDFDDLPLPPRYTEISERVEEDGVVSQSFEVRNMTPQELIDWYAEALDEFEVLEAPEEIGVETYRGQWDLDGRELTVAAQGAETLEDNPSAPEVVTQLSLSLAPPGVNTNTP